MRRSLIAGVFVGAMIAAVITAKAVGEATIGRSSCPSALSGKRDLGRLAFVDGNQLRVLQVATCSVSTLVGSGVAPPVRWSADGRYLGYGSGDVVSASGGTPTRPLGMLQPGWGGGSPGWAWSPVGHRLAGVTTRGGVALGGPGMRTLQLLPSGWGATSVAWSPDRLTLAVARSLYLKTPPPYHQAIWLVNVSTGARTLLWHLPKPDLAPPWLSGFSPDGRWLLAWKDTQNSASLAADGVPLVLISTNGGKTVALGDELIYGDFVSWCGANSLAYVQDNGGRQVTLNDRIEEAGPAPRWPVVIPADPNRSAHLSFISPECASVDGEPAIAAAGGPASQDLPFGREQRRIWILLGAGNWTPLEQAPPRGSSDELPTWSSDGRWIAFIRTTPRGSAGSGRLYLLDLGRRFHGRARQIGPIAGLGLSGNYYGHYGWDAEVAWDTRRART
jgi:dipeptidyl aminopeptidase/acylaminoacyl peptidase